MGFLPAGRAGPGTFFLFGNPQRRDILARMSHDEQIVAICPRDKSKQSVPILDLPLPAPQPEGADWIEAFRRWTSGR